MEGVPSHEAKQDGIKDTLSSTIAYQLALNLPYLDDVMQVNPNCYTTSMVVQMCSLIIDSFWRLSSTIEHIPTVIVDSLDKLDKCDGHKT